METLKSPYNPGVDTRLEQAREACAAGLVDEAISLVGTIISEVEDESDIVEAATLVPPPVDPLSRARVHLLTAEAATRVKAPVLRGRLETRLAETVDHFRPAGIVAPARMDELARTGIARHCSTRSQHSRAKRPPGSTAHGSTCCWDRRR